MKKVLLASTALTVLTAGVAAADVKFNGYARYGIKYTESTLNNPVVDETDITSRYRLSIDIETETDGGISLQARVRLQASDGGVATLNGARFSASASGLRVDIGNIAGAIDNLPNYYGYEIGLTDFIGQYNGNDFGFDNYSSTGAGQNGIYARYAFGAFAVAASFSDDGVNDEELGIHVAYTGANYGVALGYASGTIGNVAVGLDDDMIVLTGNYDFGTVDVTGFYADSDGDDTSYGLSANIEVGAATSIQVAYGDGDSADVLGENTDQAYGIGFKQNLGGGAFLRGGVGVRDDATIADLGVRFDF
jgi:outer membrane protein OmpU